jgi:hypothetical protein
MNYQDLCNAFSKNRQSWSAYRHEVYQVFFIMNSALLKKLNLPKDEEEKLVTIMPADEKKVKAGTKYTVPGAVDFHPEGWANFGFQITLREGPNIFPQQAYSFIFWLRKRKDSWIFKTFVNGPEFDLGKAPDEKSFDAPFDELLRFLYEGLEMGLENCLNDIDTNKNTPIGFKISEVSK